jgi:hypothetical protein
LNPVSIKYIDDGRGGNCRVSLLRRGWPVAFAIAHFLAWAWDGLLAGISHDDLMNMRGAMVRPWPDLLADVAVFFRFSPTYRPTAAVVYKAFHEIFGLSSFPLRVFYMGLMAANLVLLYALVKRLTRSAHAGALAALLFSYHHHFGHEYYSTGSCFDILCFTVYIGALLYYVRCREAGDLGARQSIALCALFALALGSKESAATLPGAIALYEASFHWPRGVSWRALARRAAPIAAMGVMVLLFVAIRVEGPEGIGGVGGYAVKPSLEAYFDHIAFFLKAWSYHRLPLTAWTGAALVAALVALGWRSPALRFGISFYLMTALPVALIGRMDLAHAYLPIAGVVLYVAAGVTLLADRGIGERWWRMPATLALAAAAMFPLHRSYGPQAVNWRIESDVIHSALDQLRALRPSMPKGAKVLILGDPFGPVEKLGWSSLFLFQLTYHDPTLRVDRIERIGAEEAAKARYDFVFDWRDGKWTERNPASYVLQ